MLFLKNRSVPRNISQFHWYFEEPIKLSIFLLDYVLASTLAKLSIVSSMILRELMQWHFWKRAVLIFHVFFPYSSTWLKVQSPHKLREKKTISKHNGTIPTLLALEDRKEDGQKRRWRGRLEVIYVPSAAITSTTDPLFFLWHW